MTDYRSVPRLLSSIALTVAVVLGLASSANAQAPTAGPIVFRNSTDKPIALNKITYTDAAGNPKTLDGGFTIKPGFNGYLTDRNVKIVGSKMSADITTGDGVVTFTWTVRGLDRAGDAVLQFSGENLDEHRRVLGKAPVGPTEEQVKSGLLKVIGAAIANEVANNQEGNGFGAAFVREVARGVRNEAIQGAFQDLFPQLNRSGISTARNLTVAVLDGDEIGAVDEIAKALRRVDPDFTEVTQVARFIVRVRDARKQR